MVHIFWLTLFSYLESFLKLKDEETPKINKFENSIHNLLWFHSKWLAVSYCKTISIHLGCLIKTIWYCVHVMNYKHVRPCKCSISNSQKNILGGGEGWTNGIYSLFFITLILNDLYYLVGIEREKITKKSHSCGIKRTRVIPSCRTPQRGWLTSPLAVDLDPPHW